MTYKKKTWQEKLADKPGYPKVLTLEKGFPCYNALHSMGVEAGEPVVLVKPSEVVELMRRVPEGRLVTIVEICQALARKHQVAGCCTLTAGIFTMTAANAAEEALDEGNDLGIPYWRTLKSGGVLNEKYPGGLDAHRHLLEQEGFKVVGRGKKLRVEGYEKYLDRESLMVNR